MNTKEWRERQNKLSGHIVRSSFAKTNYYKNGALIAIITRDGEVEIPNINLFPTDDIAIIDKEFLDSFTKVREEIIDESDFLNARAKAQEEHNTFIQDFKQALFEYHYISDHPKRELFFQKLQSQTKDVGEMIELAEEWIDLIK